LIESTGGNWMIIWIIETIMTDSDLLVQNVFDVVEFEIKHFGVVSD